MNIRTTLHLDEDIAQKIDSEAKKRGLTRTQFVVLLAQQIMPKYKKKALLRQSIQYQKRENGHKWKVVHINPDQMNYCFLIEMRCFYKFSVSALIAKAFNEYINNHILTTNKSKKIRLMDNYRFNGRLIMYNNSEMYIFWKLYWNLPPNLNEIFE